MKVRLLVLGSVLLALALAALAGCGGDDDEASTGAAGTTTAAAAENAVYNVGIDIPFYPMYDYIKALNGKDYFADKPYKVNFKILDATTQVPSFGKGDLDIMTTTPSFMPRVMEQYDLDLQFFFPLARWTIGPQILVPRNSPYKSLESLKGKRVAIQPLKTRFGSEEAAIQAATGENIRTYFKLKETDAAAQELALGRVEAAFLEAPATYPLLEKGKFKPLWSVKDGFVKAFGDPAVMNGGLIARKSFIEDNPEFIDDLVAAFQDAWSEYQRDPDKVNSIASKESGIPAAQLAVVGEVLNLTKMTEEQKRVTEKDVETWEKMFGYLEESGFIKEAPEDVPALFKVTE